MIDFILPAPLNKSGITGVIIQDFSPDLLKVWVERIETRGWASKAFVGYIDLNRKEYLPYRAVAFNYVIPNKYMKENLRAIMTLYTLSGSTSIRMVNK